MKDVKIDLTGKSLGRGAVEVAKILIGKNDENYAPNIIPDVSVTLENIDKIKLDSRKLVNEKYYTHSGYLGSLKEKTLQQMWDEDKIALFKKVVKGMLPKNKLTTERIKRIKVAK